MYMRIYNSNKLDIRLWIKRGLLCLSNYTFFLVILYSLIFLLHQGVIYIKAIVGYIKFKALWFIKKILVDPVSKMKSDLETYLE